MDDKVTIKELKEKIRVFCEERDWDQFHNAKDLAIGIVTEAAELLDHFRFKSKEETEAIMKDAEKNTKIAGELA
ncbi:nucleotide pyrophosphohydrolase, partial [Candidatus Woesearchaeota archaeon]|nr:nucleotide pyrophosphohydrolase [Candidatus Woesearchaeota archaeon]